MRARARARARGLEFLTGGSARLPRGTRDEAEDTDESDHDQGYGGEHLPTW